uniref:BHLH domain-containing protein n=1 Tax=Gongylonema pulchrum TaxID=637853 RepID=A0A183DS41_9BILA
LPIFTVQEDSVRNAAAVIASRLHARAQHNALERRRRDNIKDMYGALKDAIPGMRSERVSRAAVLKKAVDLIVAKQGKLEDILAENRRLMQENDALERELQGIHNACIAVPALLVCHRSSCFEKSGPFDILTKSR